MKFDRAAGLRHLIVVLFLTGIFLIITDLKQIQIDPKSDLLLKHLSQYKPAQRVEIYNLTERLYNDVEMIRNQKFNVSQDSFFYISIDFFTDEKDAKAPLIAQIKFYDLRTQNKIKEENIDIY